jgi:hypothetical protein
MHRDRVPAAIDLDARDRLLRAAVLVRDNAPGCAPLTHAAVLGYARSRGPGSGGRSAPRRGDRTKVQWAEALAGLEDTHDA